MLEKVVLADAFAGIDAPWQPRLAAEVDGMHVRVVRLEGDFVWHHHAEEDELFLVVSGRLTMRLRDGDVELGPGELVVVPAGVEHCPSAPDGAEVVLVERASVVNTGSAGGARTAPVRPL